MRLCADFSVRRGAFAAQIGLEVESSRTLAIIGDSGSGKTTALRCLAGLLRPQSGCIRLDDRVWFDSARRIDVPAYRRGAVMVFGAPALFAHLSVLENAAFGLRAAGTGAKRAAESASAALETVEAGHLAERRAGTLSGGEAQRVALARALAVRPAALLLDEPLAALDVRTRAAVRTALRRVIQELSVPTVLVTHEPSEAMWFAEQLVVLEAGNIVQRGRLPELRARPATPYVASFAGVNLFRGAARPAGDGTSIVVAQGGLTLVVRGEWSGAVSVVVDEDAVTLSRREPATSARNRIGGIVESVLPAPGGFVVSVSSAWPIVARITAQSAAELGIEPGADVFASFKAGELRVY